MTRIYDLNIYVVAEMRGELLKIFQICRRRFALIINECMAEIVEKEQLQVVAKEIASHTKHIGMLDADFIITNEGEVFLIDLNPRFGGGYPFSHLSGLNVPELYKKWLNNEQPSPADLTIAYGAVIAKGISLHKQK